MVGQLRRPGFTWGLQVGLAKAATFDRVGADVMVVLGSLWGVRALSGVLTLSRHP